MILTPHMTTPQGAAQAALEAAAVPGMAHWAGSGPAGETCRGCTHWGAYVPHKRDEVGLLRNRQCQKFKRMAGGVAGAGVPAPTMACRHFEPGTDVPELQVEPKRRKANDVK